MIDITNVKEIVGDEIKSWGIDINYYEYFLMGNEFKDSKGTIIEETVHFYFSTSFGEAEIVGNYGSEVELRNLLEQAVEGVVPHKKNRPDCLNRLKLKGKQENKLILYDNTTTVYTQQYFLNSYDLYKQANRTYYYVEACNDKRLLFLRRKMEEINEDMRIEQKILSDATNIDEASVCVLAPRVAHQIISNLFSRIIYLKNAKLLDLYVSSMNVKFQFADCPNSQEGVYENTFDIYGNDYVNKTYICNGRFYGFSESDIRYEINNNRIKKGIKFSKLEVADYEGDNYNYAYFSDFLGKIDIYSNYISGMLIGEKGNLRVESKLTTFISEILGGYGEMTNVKYIYAGAAPYVVKRMNVESVNKV